MFGRRANHLDLALEQKPEIIQRVKVQWIVDGDGQHVVVEANRDGLVAHRLVAWQQLNDLGLDEDLTQVDELHVGGSRHGARDVLFGNAARRNERRDDAGAVFGGLFARFENLATGDHAGVLEKLQNVIFVGSHDGREKR